MYKTNAEVRRFLAACDELIDGKFILADRKIGEVLKAIAASDELTRLFQAATAGFDYASAKRLYLKPARAAGRGEAYLPTKREDVLAYVFCLMAEFDSGTLRFNDFLLRYFYEDGSYTASYTFFTDRMIRPFRDIVRDCYPNAQRAGAVSENRDNHLLEELSEKIAVERGRIQNLDLGDDALAAETILAEMYAAVGRGNVAELKALIYGYGYFLSEVKAADENSAELLALGAIL